MATRIGINGFGRIGRCLTRLLADDKDLELAVINARATNKDLAHLLKYDSVHGPFPRVEGNGQGFLLDGRQVVVTRFATGEWSWKDLGCDIVIESTGKLNDRAGCSTHLACGARRVILSAPGKEMDATIVVGVNDADLRPEHRIISSASCTTNCLAPAVKALHSAFGIRHGLMTTIHSYTMDQRLHDGSHKDIRRARAAALNIVPTTTGAARALSLVIPEMKGRLDGFAIRVPTPDVSIVDLTCELGRATTREEVNAVMQAAANESFGYTEEPLVSSDFVGSTFGGVVDAGLTNVIGGTQVKLIVWYDNESGFTNQLLRLIRKAAALN
ncbi:MAG: type I glyceraldehyde-3-phosphate dehydrogenase [Desulfovibrio sp.]|jgi:glyceraldehyde 3-phosphate dehydrogenase|nr:type I glyceraldehyde-3-phosphate dehydrogenase [Desulfovibrio sp.]